MDLPKKICATFALFLFAILEVHPAVLAAFQVGVEAQLKNDQLVVDTTRLNWWLTDNWALRGDYSWNTDVLGLAALYKINPKAKAALYLGLSENDLSGAVSPGLSPGQRIALIAGMEWDWSRIKPGLSLMVEAGTAPSYFFNQPGGNHEPASRLGISLNYRFPPANTAKEPDDKGAAKLLAKLITLEASGEPFEGQVAIAAVVLNRIRSNDFPDSVPDVVYQRGQFHTARKLAKTVPGESALKAAKMALQGSDPSRGALYFYNPATCSVKTRQYIQAHFQVTVRIGNHVFLR
jgi:hypothetical protein